MIKLCFLDTETTGNNPYKNAIISLSGETGEFNEATREYLPFDSFSFSMRPFDSDAIDDTALAVNGFSREQIAEFRDPRDVHKDFQATLALHCDKFNKRDKYFLVAYNAGFDADFVRHWFEKCEDKYYGSWFWTPPLDVMQFALRKLLHRRAELQNFRLGTVAKEFLSNVDEANLHDSGYDIKITKEIFFRTYPA